jgi:hypothetical protein
MKWWGGLLCSAVVATSIDAKAFCGFYVAPSDAPLYADATMVALMREGTRTALTMSNNYKGPLADFAMVVPVPVVLNKEDVRTLPPHIFKRLETLSAPRLVEYWEQDPCPYDQVDPDRESGTGTKHKGAEGMMGDPAKKPFDYGVTIEAQFSVEEYDVVVLGAEQSDGLERWLIDNHYKIPNGAAAVLAPYIKEQMKFFVAKIDASKVKKDETGVVVLSPLRFHYESADFRLPVRLGLLNSSGQQDLIVFTLSKSTRYETANYPNVFIPTNIDVKDETRDAFGPFYASLFDATLAKAGRRAVVTEYAWSSSSCDPCPTPPLAMEDLNDLGGDALLGMKKELTDAKTKTYRVWNGQHMVLTRLHTRYDASTLTEDLVFRAAPPIVGGREPSDWGPKVPIERGATPSETNQFQARYAIRHLWEGPITCDDPERGVWGGPPDGHTSKAAAATGLAAAPRNVGYYQYAASRIDELGFSGRGAGSVPRSSGRVQFLPFVIGLFLGGIIVWVMRQIDRRIAA